LKTAKTGNWILKITREYRRLRAAPVFIWKLGKNCKNWKYAIYLNGFHYFSVSIISTPLKGRDGNSVSGPRGAACPKV